MADYDFSGQPQFQQNAGADYNNLMGGRNRLALMGARQNLTSQGIGGRTAGAIAGAFGEAQNRQGADVANRFAQRQADLAENQRRLVSQRQLQNEGIQRQQDYNRQMQDLTQKWRKEDFIKATSGSAYGKVGGAIGTVAGGIIGGYLGKSPQAVEGGMAIGGAAGSGIGGAIGEASGGTSMSGSYDPYGYSW